MLIKQAQASLAVLGSGGHCDTEQWGQPLGSQWPKGMSVNMGSQKRICLKWLCSGCCSVEQFSKVGRSQAFGDTCLNPGYASCRVFLRSGPHCCPPLPLSTVTALIKIISPHPGRERVSKWLSSSPPDTLLTFKTDVSQTWFWSFHSF